MLEFKAKTNEGIPYLCQDTDDDGWAVAVIYAAARETENPYIAHILNPEQEETSFSVARDRASTRLSFVSLKGDAPSDKVDWLKDVVMQYDNVLEGLGE
jgi:hypothetical protein